MRILNVLCFEALMQHLEQRAPDLLAICRWLACGPEMAPAILGEDARLPTASDLGRLADALESAPISAAVAGRALIADHSRFVSDVDVATERLLAAGDNEWSHPTEIIGRPCPDFRDLLAAFRDRLEEAPGAGRRRLERIVAKLERAVALEAKARGRRGVRA